MPTGEQISRCQDCGASFTSSDCIRQRCNACECQAVGHLQVGNLCGRCGAKLAAQYPVDRYEVRAETRPGLLELVSRHAQFRDAVNVSAEYYAEHGVRTAVIDGWDKGKVQG